MVKQILRTTMIIPKSGKGDRCHKYAISDSDTQIALENSVQDLKTLK